MNNTQKLQFTLNIIPPNSTAQSGKKLGTIINKKTGKAFTRMYKTKQSIEVEKCYYAVLYQHRPQKMLTGPLKLEAKFYYPYRKSEKKSIVKAGKLVPKTTKSDGDNLSKQFTDVLTKLGFMEDDALIFDLHIVKYWAPEGKIEVQLEEVEQ